MADRTVNVTIKGKNEVGPAVAGLKQITGELTSLKSLAATALGGLGVAGILKESFQAYSDQIQAETKLAATLAATGNAAKLSSKELVDFASKRQELTTFADEVTISAEAMLASFKNISGDTFKRAIVASQDLATALGKDLNSAVMALGKAINNPTEGMKGLSKVGIILSDVQKSQIKSFMEMNDVADAQGIILKELEARFGGISEAMANTPTGQIEMLKNSIGEIGEVIGKIIAPAVAQMAIDMKAFADESVRSHEIWMGWSDDDFGQVLKAYTKNPSDLQDVVKLRVGEQLAKADKWALENFGISMNSKGEGRWGVGSLEQVQKELAEVYGRIYPADKLRKELDLKYNLDKINRRAAEGAVGKGDGPTAGGGAFFGKPDRRSGDDFGADFFGMPLPKKKELPGLRFSIWDGIGSALSGLTDSIRQQRLGTISTELANPFALLGRGLAGAFSGVGRDTGGFGSNVVEAQTSPFVRYGYQSQAGPEQKVEGAVKDAAKVQQGLLEKNNQLLERIQQTLEGLNTISEAVL